MPRQYHLTANGERVPVNPDCGIGGCGRAEYRAGLCRRHFGVIPYAVRIQRANEMMVHIHEYAKAKRAEMVTLAQSEVDRAKLDVA